jgi:hypothetical protein
MGLNLPVAVVLGVGFLGAEQARDVVELEPVAAAEDPCILGPEACTFAWEVGSTCFVARGTAGSTLLAVGMLEHSLCFREYQKVECQRGAPGWSSHIAVAAGSIGLGDAEHKPAGLPCG